MHKPYQWQTMFIDDVILLWAGADVDSSRDADHGQQDHPPTGAGGTLAFRDDKQETMVVRPYPQVQTHGQPQASPQTVPIQPGTPVTVPAPSVHLPQGQPAVLHEGQMKVSVSIVLFSRPGPCNESRHLIHCFCTFLRLSWSHLCQVVSLLQHQLPTRVILP